MKDNSRNDSNDHALDGTPVDAADLKLPADSIAVPLNIDHMSIGAMSGITSIIIADACIAHARHEAHRETGNTEKANEWNEKAEALKRTGMAFASMCEKRKPGSGMRAAKLGADTAFKAIEGMLDSKPAAPTSGGNN